MIEPNRPPASPAATFEMRPSANRHINPDAPDDIVLPASASRAGSGGSFFDYINPLQHLPIVGTVYRAVTGATVSPSARIVGGLLYGGPIGFATSFANAMVENASGKDISEHAMAAVGIGGKQGKFPTLDRSANFAQVAPPPPPQNVDAIAMNAAGGVQLASSRIETGNSLLATWIAGPGQDASRAVAQARPDAVRPATPNQTTPTLAAPAQAAVPQPASIDTARANTGNLAGRSLVEYRASAINATANFRGLATAGPTGVSRIPASAAQPTSRSGASDGALSAPLQAQTQRETGEADNYYSAQMLAGLERYARLQRERLSEGQRT